MAGHDKRLTSWILHRTEALLGGFQNGGPWQKTSLMNIAPCRGSTWSNPRYRAVIKANVRRFWTIPTNQLWFETQQVGYFEVTSRIHYLINFTWLTDVTIWYRPCLKQTWETLNRTENVFINTKTYPFMYVTMKTFLCPFLLESPRLNLKLLWKLGIYSKLLI